MNKYQEALDEFWEAYVALIGMNKKTIILKNGDYEHDFIKYKKSLQELVDLTKSGEYYNKKDLIDELDKVYTVAKKHYDLIHYADIYRIIEKVVQDE